MGRPKAVIHENFHLYDKLHTEQTRMMSGVEMTTLHPIKETKEYYMGIEVWAYCASKFKRKKKNLKNLEVNINVLTDSKGVEFLKKHSWSDKVLGQDETEASDFLKRLYPNKKFIYFYELDSILGAFNHGNFVRYDRDENGNHITTESEPREGDLDQRAYYTHKYNKWFMNDVPHIKKLYDKYHKYRNEKGNKNYDEKEKTRLFGEYYDAERKYVMENFDLTDTFRKLGEHAVCLPMSFSDPTAEWYEEKYGKTCAYSHAGEVFFIVTEGTIYLNVKRHF